MGVAGSVGKKTVKRATVSWLTKVLPHHGAIKKKKKRRRKKSIPLNRN